MRLAFFGIIGAGSLAPAGGAAATPDNTMRLELARLDGSAFVRLSDFAGKVVVLNFWRSDCPPCGAEMPVLSEFSQANTDIPVIGIATEEASRARRFVERQRISTLQLSAPAQSQGLLRRFGNTKGALPYTVVLDEQHKICLAKVGAVDTQWLKTALGRCSGW
jgi:peroxiredoxin